MDYKPFRWCVHVMAGSWDIPGFMLPYLCIHKHSQPTAYSWKIKPRRKKKQGSTVFEKYDVNLIAVEQPTLKYSMFPPDNHLTITMQ